MTPFRLFRGASLGLHLALLGGFAVLVAASPAHAQATYDQSRTSSFTYFVATDGAKAGLLKTETIEPNNTQLCVTTTYDYDAYGNKKIATTANCSGASGNALFASRSSASTYATQSVTVAGVVGVVVPAGAFPTTSTNALSQSDSKIYDPRFGAALSLTGPNGLTTSWTLDDFGRTITENHADGTRTFSYYCYITGRASDTSSNTPGCPTPLSAEVPTDAIAFVHTEPHDNSASTGLKNGPFSRVYTDRAGRKIRTVTEAYDGANQPGGTSRLIVQDADYSPYGPQIIATQPYFLDSGASTSAGATHYGMSRTDYDVLGRPVAVYTAEVKTAVAGSTSGEQGGNGGTQAFGNRGSFQASKSSVTYAGLSTTIVDDNGKTLLQEKNIDGKVVRVTDALGAQVAYQLDAFGNLLTTKDALQNLVQVSYDTRGRKISMADPDSGVWGYCYDALGQLVAQQNSKMRGSDTPGACPTAPNNAGTTANAVAGWATMAYDVLGRVTSRVEPEYGTTWTYDKYASGSACNKGVGKLCEVNSSNGVNRKSVYDNFGRPVNSRTTIASGPSFASAVGYDSANGRPVSQTYPTGLQVNYVYTAKGFLTSLSLATPATVTPLPATAGGTPVASATLPTGTMLWRADAYNAWGKAEQQTYGNNVVNKAAFDATTGRLTNLTAGVGSATNVVNYGYVFDSIGRIVQRNDANGDGTTGAVGDAFSYDDIGRLSAYTVNAPLIPNLQRTVALQYNALGMTLYKADVGNYAYGAQATTGVRPHALLSVAGAVTASYGYDANGNLVSASSGKYRSISYTSFNLPDSNSGAQGPSGSPQYTWQYDENHQRVKEIEVSSAGTRTTWEMHPDNQGGLAFESESSTASPTPMNRHYLSVGGISIGVLVSNSALPILTGTQTTPPTIASITLLKVEYWHKDNLGSLIATTDHLGNVTARYAYDPFGKRRFTYGSYDAFGTLVVDWTTNTNNGTDRGYTGHEHLDDIGIIHMNGRIYDPTLGRFMQADPLIQDPFNLQNYDRYGYCYNNPIACIDPTGQHFSLRKLIGIVVAVVFACTIGPEFSSWITAEFVMNADISYGIASFVGAVANGAVSGFIGGAIATGNSEGALQGAFSGGLTAGLFNAAGTAIEDSGGAGVSSDGTVTRGSKFAGAIALHGVAGCVSSVVASGGRCGPGALSAAFSEAALPFVAGQGPVTGLVVSSVVGGTTSVLGGGKFSNGAETAAFAYVFNCLGHKETGPCSELWAKQGAVAGTVIGISVAAACDFGTVGTCLIINYPIVIGSAGGLGLLGYGAGALSDWAYDHLTFQKDSTVLGTNLITSGETRNDDDAAHHIVASGDNRAAPARAALAANGMDINDANNGTFVQGNYHATIHTDTYYTMVNAILIGSTSYNDVAQRLAVIRGMIQAGTFPH